MVDYYNVFFSDPEERAEVVRFSREEMTQEPGRKSAQAAFPGIDETGRK